MKKKSKKPDKEPLTISAFTRQGEPGSFAHTFTHVLPDGRQICLESCMSGYCVGLYDQKQELLVKKTCTNIEGMEEMQIARGFSLASGEALTKGMEIANKIFAKL
jgi:hypothetical protein